MLKFHLTDLTEFCGDLLSGVVGDPDDPLEVSLVDVETYEGCEKLNLGTTDAIAIFTARHPELLFGLTRRKGQIAGQILGYVSPDDPQHAELLAEIRATGPRPAYLTWTHGGGFEVSGFEVNAVDRNLAL